MISGTGYSRPKQKEGKNVRGLGVRAAIRIAINTIHKKLLQEEEQ